MTILVIVESPKKVETLQAYLGDDYKVAASGGHIRDLPDKPAEGIGFTMPNYVPQYELLSRSSKTIAWLKKLAGQCDSILLATDPDREGEAIAWHLAQVLRISRPLRITFNEVTKTAVLDAIRAPRPIDMNLVAAQEARRSIDRLVGYQVSRPLGDAIGRRGVSAGRVQSPAVALVVEREREIQSFVSRTHYETVLHFNGHDGAWRATWQFDSLLKGTNETLWLDLTKAELVAKTKKVVVRRCEETDETEAPPAPFTTSTLQQAASVALDFNPETTMRLAQSLKDRGHITYHRTDNPNLTDEAIAEIRAYAAQHGLPIPQDFRRWKSKKNAQEAHPAIQPTNFAAESAGDTPEEQALYRLIRIRAIACQLADAQYAVRRVYLESTDHTGTLPFLFLATGRTLSVKGWRQLLTGPTELDEDAEAPIAANPVPHLAVSTGLEATKGECLTRKTQPPKRYSEATLIRALEQAGVGRPSTYATIMSGIKNHQYVTVEKKRLHATDLGFQIYDILKPNFSFMQLDYTCTLEEELDAMAQGKGRYLELVRKVDGDIQQELGRMPKSAPAPAQSASPPLTSGYALSKQPRAKNRATVICLECGKEMLRRERKSDRSHFWGCSGFPDCKATLQDNRGKPVPKAIKK